MSKELDDITKQLQSFMGQSADAISIVDLAGRTLQVNAAFEECFGWKNEELFGGPLPNIPEFLKQSAEELHEQVKSGEQKKGYETVRQRKGGQLIDVSITLFTIQNNENEPMALAFVYRDITHQKMAEMALKESEERYRSLVEASPEAIFVHRNGIIEYMNPEGARMLGMNSVKDIIGKSVFQFVHPDSQGTVNERIHVMRDEGKKVDLLEQKFRRNNGDVFFGETIALPIIYKGYPAIQVFCRDITERKKTEELLAKTNMLSALGQLAAGVAHEVRNPLTAIKGFLQLMKEIPDKLEYLDMAAREVDKIERLTDEFICLASPPSQTSECIQISALVDSVIKLAKFQAILFNIEITKESSIEDTTVFGEANSLKQVFTNIVNNAMEAMKEGGKLHITLDKHGEEDVMIRFVDSGRGMTEERMKHLGQPFYSTTEKGTGLGLMVSSKIIQEHRGQIHFSSEVGKGTTVEIILPTRSRQ